MTVIQVEITAIWKRRENEKRMTIGLLRDISTGLIKPERNHSGQRTIGDNLRQSIGLISE